MKGLKKPGPGGRLYDPQFVDTANRVTHPLPSPGRHSIQVIHRNSGADMLAGLHSSKARAYADGFTVRMAAVRRVSLGPLKAAELQRCSRDVPARMACTYPSW